jgi:hypothetical protein
MTRMGNVAGYRAAFIEAQAAQLGQVPEEADGRPAEEAAKKKRTNKDDDEAGKRDLPNLAKDTLMPAR